MSKQEVPAVAERNDQKKHSSGGRLSPEHRRRNDQLVVGRLQAHGVANYQFRGEESPSYFARVLTNRGERVLWGKDLERALRSAATQPQVGDMIGAQRVRRQAVSVIERKRDEHGRVLSQTEHHAHRSEWRIEKIQFFAERAKMARRVREEHTRARAAVQAQPELKSTFLSLRAAEELAARKIADPADRARFMELLRTAMSTSIAKGEPLPDVRLKERAHEVRTTLPQRRRDEPTR